MSKIYILSGPSGVGKGSIIDALMDDNNLKLKWIKTATTRDQRPDDAKYGRHQFITHEQFISKISNNDFAEYNYYNGHYYGTLKEEIERARKSGHPSVMEIDINGSNTLKQKYPDDVVQIFIFANLSDIKARLHKRGMPDNLIRQRLEIAKQEIAKSQEFQYRVENRQNKLNKAVESIRTIINGGERK